MLAENLSVFAAAVSCVEYDDTGDTGYMIQVIQVMMQVKIKPKPCEEDSTSASIVSSSKTKLSHPYLLLFFSCTKILSIPV